MNANRIIFVTGLPGSGKSSVSRILESLGWHIISAGDIIREECKKARLSVDLDTLQKYGAELLKTKGDEYFSSLLMGKIKDHEKIVFEGIRPPNVLNNILATLGGTVIYIETKQETRFNRLKYRDNITIETFNKIEKNKLEQQVKKIKKFSNIIISNNLSHEELTQNILRIVLTEQKHTI